MRGKFHARYNSGVTVADRSVIRVLVADDHPAFAEGLVRLLSEEADLAPVGMAGNGEEALALARTSQPDVVVMDFVMPGMNGVEATRQLKAERPEVAVLVLSAYGHLPYVLAALEAGAGGYLIKNAPMRELISAIRALHSGEMVIDSSLAAEVVRSIAPSRVPGARATSLSASDCELLKLGATGMTNRAIAARLSVSERTVQARLTAICAKLGVASRIEAVIKAIKEGWLMPEDLP